MIHPMFLVADTENVSYEPVQPRHLFRMKNEKRL